MVSKFSWQTIKSSFLNLSFRILKIYDFKQVFFHQLFLVLWSPNDTKVAVPAGTYELGLIIQAISCLSAFSMLFTWAKIPLPHSAKSQHFQCLMKWNLLYSSQQPELHSSCFVLPINLTSALVYKIVSFLRIRIDSYSLLISGKKSESTLCIISICC